MSLHGRSLRPSLTEILKIAHYRTILGFKIMLRIIQMTICVLSREKSQISINSESLTIAKSQLTKIRIRKLSRITALNGLSNGNSPVRLRKQQKIQRASTPNSPIHNKLSKKSTIMRKNRHRI